MADARDAAIKLFGMTIPLTDGGSASDPDASPITDPPAHRMVTCKELAKIKAKDTMSDIRGEKTSIPSLNDANDDDNQTSATQDIDGTADPTTDQDQSEPDTSGQEKALKKPDKILPCPRCKSLDTKFCYYNNYNVNQPRHFCKRCQRYWTAGGAMRKVPVGSGRRRNKNCGSHPHHVTVPSDVATSAQEARAPLNGSGSVLNFEAEMPLCESMSSSLNLGEQKSAAAASDSAETEIPSDRVRSEGFSNGFVPMYPTPPLAYHWNPVCQVAAPTIPIPLMPAFWPSGAWNVPRIGHDGSLLQSSLGKHSRDASLRVEEKAEKLCIPKTLRIVDPDEAAQSSIWSTLGIRPDLGGVFRALQSKDESESQESDTARVLRTNRAALLRCRSFQEST